MSAFPLLLIEIYFSNMSHAIAFWNATMEEN